MPSHRSLVRFLLPVLAAGWFAAAALAAPADRARQIEEDWLVQARLRGVSAEAASRVSAQDDAAGACDGVKDGKWAFHTASEARPWWQVDLGGAHPLDRVLVYNRCDGTAGRASRLLLLLSADGKQWREAYRHDGRVFYGATDGKPLAVALRGAPARFVRIQLPGAGYLHLDEVEVYGRGDPKRNLALGKPADQSSTSQWSTPRRAVGADASYPTALTVERGRKLAADLRSAGVDAGACARELDAVEVALKRLPAGAPGDRRKELYLRARGAIRKLAFANPLLDFDRLVFVKRVPGSYSHMSDQYYGWWSRPGGGVFVLEGLKSAQPRLRCLTERMPTGSFLRPDLSYDGRKVLFAYCKHYPHVAGVRNKVDKAKIPEDAFYHVYEMNVDGSGLRRLTRGHYDDFDARYLPSGRIVFLSTRRGQFVQCGRRSAAATVASPALPDSYVRCGGGNWRPVAIYTLHAMDADGTNLRAISAFENFEWTPSVWRDGRVLFARWDYVDRHNMPYMSLWATNPDGSNPQAVYGNFTHSPHCIFEARGVPGSGKILFTASAHHAITGGSLVLLDPDVGRDGADPITRLTPEVRFPEIEGWPRSYYANPFPLSERYYLVAWSARPIRSEGGGNPGNALGLYLYDAFGNLELIYRDPAISSMCPLPLRPRPRPPVARGGSDSGDALEGRFFLLDVYEGLTGVERGAVKSIRVVGVPAKTQPHMNRPSLGATRDDPGKCVFGTAPVEPDGSAYFRVPAGVNLFFQALDSRGRTVQTMRTVTYVQPNQTFGCIGCHEPRNTAPRTARATALRRAPSKLRVGPTGAWPLRYDRLVQPVLDRHCTRCHKPGGKAKAVAKLDLTAGKSYAALVSYGGGASLHNLVRARYGTGRSQPGRCVSTVSALAGAVLGDKPHQDVRLDADSRERLLTWMDTYAQRLGSFSDDQEARLRRLRTAWADLLVER